MIFFFFILTTGIIKVVGIECFFIQATYGTTVLLEGQLFNIGLNTNGDKGPDNAQ